jgi:hypothetical protein
MRAVLYIATFLANQKPGTPKARAVDINPNYHYKGLAVCFDKILLTVLSIRAP